MSEVEANRAIQIARSAVAAIDWRLLWQRPLHFLFFMGLGAALSFVYSYTPLHAAKDWQIEYLQQRIDAQNQKLNGLEGQLASAVESADDLPDPAEFAAQSAAMKSAKGEVASLSTKLDKAERTIKSLRSSVSQWKSRHKAVSEELADARRPTDPPPALAGTSPPRPQPVPSVATSDEEAPPTAADPAPVAAPAPAGDSTAPAAPVP